VLKVPGRTKPQGGVTGQQDTAVPPKPQTAMPTTPAKWPGAPATNDQFGNASARPAGPVSLDGASGGDLARAFPSFDATVNGVQGRVVPIDITGEQITVDVQGDALKISSSLDFRQNEAGMPILNMLPEPTALEVDGKTLDPAQLPRVAVGPGGKLVSSDEYAKLQLYEKTDLQPGRVLAQPLERGTHSMKVSETLTKASLAPDDRDASLTIDKKGVDWFLRDSDLEKTAGGGIARAASFGGAYLPSNFQFDRIPTTIRINLPKAPPEQKIFTNGKLKPTGDGQGVEVKFPPGLTTSEMFLHVVPADQVAEQSGTFKSIDGRNIKVTTYAQKDGMPANLLPDAQKTINDTMQEMERLFGPFPHDSFTAQMWPDSMPQDGGTGMEYAGATEATPDALRHETIHSWFGRSLSPADGNAGWLDEAVTTWLTAGHPTRDAKSTWEHDLTVDSVYEQDTNRAGYDAGVNLLQDLDIDLRNTRGGSSGVIPALQDLFHKFEGKPLNNDDFVKTMVGAAQTPAQAAAVRQTLARFGLGKQNPDS
jgi:hypothetical protein